jgi:hypothetical protein
VQRRRSTLVGTAFAFVLLAPLIVAAVVVAGRSTPLDENFAAPDNLGRAAKAPRAARASATTTTVTIPAATATALPPVSISPTLSPAKLRAGDTPIAPAPEHFDAPPAKAAPPPAPLRNAQYQSNSPSGATGTGVWAVIIGINDYPGTKSDLRSAVNDAADVSEALARFGVPGNQRLVVTDTQATAGVIRSSADWLVQNAGPSATAVFFYAGHVRKAGSHTEALVGADGATVSDADLANHLRNLAARETWIGIAACYGGGFTEVLAPGRVLVAAADDQHLAYENEGFGRSYMVEYMVRKAMIEGRAPASIESAFAYAKATLDRDYPGRSPVQYDQSDGFVDVHQSPAPGGSSGGGTSGSYPPPEPAPTTTTTGPTRCLVIFSCS